MLFKRAMRLLQNCNQRCGRVPAGLTVMLTHWDQVCNHRMQRKWTCGSVTCSDILRSKSPQSAEFDLSVMESAATFRSFFCLPSPDGPAARPSRDRDARSAALIWQTRSYSTHHWPVAEAHHRSRCDGPDWGA